MAWCLLVRCCECYRASHHMQAFNNAVHPSSHSAANPLTQTCPSQHPSPLCTISAAAGRRGRGQGAAVGGSGGAGAPGGAPGNARSPPGLQVWAAQVERAGSSGGPLCRLPPVDLLGAVVGCHGACTDLPPPAGTCFHSSSEPGPGQLVAASAPWCTSHGCWV